MASSKLPSGQDSERDRRAGLPGLGAWLEAVSPTPAREFSCRAADDQLRPDLDPRPAEPDPVVTVEYASSFPPNGEGRQKRARSESRDGAAGPVPADHAEKTSESGAQVTDPADPAAGWTSAGVLARLSALLRR